MRTDITYAVTALVTLYGWEKNVNDRDNSAAALPRTNNISGMAMRCGAGRGGDQVQQK